MLDVFRAANVCLKGCFSPIGCTEASRTELQAPHALPSLSAAENDICGSWTVRSMRVFVQRVICLLFTACEFEEEF